MISIQPKWVEKILNGEKTIEIRKTMPKCELPIDVYIYCTKDPKHLVAPFHFKQGLAYREYNDNTYYSRGCTANVGEDINGKVVAKFTLNKIEQLDEISLFEGMDEINNSRIEEYSCVDIDSLLAYKSNKEYIYAWCIDNLEIFDKPKDLSEFTYRCVDDSKCDNCPYYYCHNTESDSEKGCSCDCRKPITKAPQSWQFVEVEE